MTKTKTSAESYKQLHTVYSWWAKSTMIYLIS